MSSTTTAQRHYLFQPLVSALGIDLPITASRSQICAAAAGFYIGADTPYLPGGRDAEGLDGFGFVRACVQAALDWTPGLGFTPGEPIADLTHYMGWPREEPSSATIAVVVQAWGLVQVDKHYCKSALPGDVLMTLGRGPGASIVTHAITHNRGQQVALVWAPNPPMLRPTALEGRMPVRAYRFAEEV